MVLSVTFLIGFGLTFAQPANGLDIQKFALPTEITQIHSAEIGDVNGNAMMDVLCIFSDSPSSAPNKIGLFEFTNETYYHILFQFDLHKNAPETIFTSAVAGDLDGDGLQEIIATINPTIPSRSQQENPDWLYVFDQKSLETNQEPMPFNFQIDGSNKVLVRPQQIAKIKINNSGRDALVVALGSPERKVAIVQLENDFQSAQWNILDLLSPKEITGYMNYVMTLGDINGNHKTDILLSMIHNGINLVGYEYSNGQFTQIVNQHIDWNRRDAFPSQIDIFDLDNDNQNEIIFTSPKNGLTILHQHMTGRFQLSPYSNLCEFSDFALDGRSSNKELLLVHPNSKRFSRLISNVAGLQSSDGISEYEFVLPTSVQGDILFFESNDGNNLVVLRNTQGEFSFLTFGKTFEPEVETTGAEVSTIVQREQKEQPEEVTQEEENIEVVSEAAIETIQIATPQTPDYVVAIGKEFRHEIEVKIEALGSSRTIYAAPEGMHEVGGNLVWTPNKTQIGFHRVGYDVIGPQIEFSNEFHVYVNAIPIFNSLPDTVATVGRLYNYQIDALDNNQDAKLSYELILCPSGAEINEDGEITWIPTKDQSDNNKFLVRISDGFATTDQSFQVFCNDPIQFECSPDSVVFLGEKYTTQLISKDNNFVGKKKYSLLKNPEGMTIDFPESPAPRVEWTPAGDILDFVSVRFLVSDGFSTDTLYHSIFVNSAPKIISTTDTLHNHGELFQYNIETENRNKNQTLVYNLIESPDGMEIDKNLGIVSWTPDSTQLGHFSYKIEVSDGFQTDIQENILFVNFVPIIASIPQPVTLTDYEYLYEIIVDERNKNENIRYHAIKIPKYCTISEKTGQIRWKPTRAQVGLNDFQIEVMDSHGGRQLHDFTVRVVSNPQHQVYVLSIYHLVFAVVGIALLMGGLSL